MSMSICINKAQKFLSPGRISCFLHSRVFLLRPSVLLDATNEFCVCPGTVNVCQTLNSTLHSWELRTGNIREGNGKPLQYSCLENPMDGGAHATERLHFHFSLSHNGEGNGGPLQCSCLENPRDGRAWWAAICGVAQSRTRLKRLSSNNVTSSGLLPTLLPSNSIQITVVFQLQPALFSVTVLLSSL